MFEKHKDKIIILLLVVVGSLLFYIVLDKQGGGNSDRNTARARSQLKESKKNRGGEVDPYEKNEVKNTILKNAANPIQDCFREFMKKNPDFVVGRVTVDWQIQLDGSVDKAEIVSSEIPDINSCIKDNIEKLKFPRPPGEDPWYIVHKFFFKRDDPTQEGKSKVTTPKDK